MQQLEDLKRKVDTVLSDKVHELPYAEYESLLMDDEVREKIALRLMDKFHYLKSCSMKEMSTYIKSSDKDLFLKLSNGMYTLDQLKARIAERKTGVKYVVLDDLRDSLNPKFFEPHKTKGGQRDGHLGYSPKSRAKSHFMRSVSREGGLRHQNYQKLPESVGQVDYDPQEICKRTRYKPHKQSTDWLFNIPKVKEFVPD